MNEHPEQMIPAGLATMRFARLPAISVGPASVDGLPLVTWFRITRALLLPRNGLPWTQPAIWVCEFWPLLLSTTPAWPTL
ncbi:hypothetical protein GO283_03455 [Ralstonia solanacearum]|nr:hypothetical protein [Ralstonia solanacearum]NJZ80141.1 hypothetical protein [Ralstonia solanacearum]NKA59448.1 hypothetical protein [Ralstonia solanacearum]NKA75556.1 hypothetical protein [Ralstonia solanacearum]NKA90175.1 hypothetical protein [Ralstonia solanacearum]